MGFLKLNKLKLVMTKNKKIYVLAFLIPFILMVLIYAFVGIIPFGNESILALDLEGQYYQFFSYYKDMITGGGDGLYSFSQSIGSSTIGLFAYYLASPLNLILLFVLKQHIEYAIIFMLLIKISLCGLTCCIYLKKRFSQGGYSTIIFSTCYALMSYIMVYQFNIMWLDCIFLLPLICLGIFNIIQNNRFMMYIITLAIAIFSNYYIAYMVCIFSVLYFIYELIIKKINTGSYNLKGNISCFIRSSILSGGLCACIIIPVIYTLTNGKSGSDSGVQAETITTNIIDVLSKMFIGSNNMDQIKLGYPNIFCGTIIILLVFLYFLNSSIRKKERVVSFAFILIFIISFSIDKINLIWHASQAPIWYGYRYSFFLSFIFIMFAYRSFHSLKRISIKKCFILVVSFIIISIICLKQGYEYIDLFKVGMTCLIFILATWLLKMYKRTAEIKKTRFIVIIITILTISELLINGYLSMIYIIFSPKDKKQELINVHGEIIEKIKSEDKSFYRMEDSYLYDRNSPFWLNYNGLRSFTSTEDVSKVKFMRRLGFNTGGFWNSYDDGGSLLAESLLGLKYLVTKETKEEYELLYVINDFNIYKNPYSLPIGYLSDRDVLNTDLSKSKGVKNNSNILMNGLSKNDNVEYFKNINVKDIVYENVIESNEGNLIKFNKVDKDKAGSIEISVDKQGKFLLYAYINILDLEDVMIKKNDIAISARNGLIPLGMGDEETKLTIYIKPDCDEIKMILPEFSALNMDLFKEFYNELTNQSIDIDEWRNSYFKGRIVSDDEDKILLTTIPYDDGWSVKVDGEKVSKIKVLDTLIGVEISRGEHIIELSFYPKGLNLGIGITVISFIIIIIYIKNKSIRRN